MFSVHYTKLPIIYITSPYFAGVAEDLPGSMWNVERELGGKAEERVHPSVKRRAYPRPGISLSHTKNGFLEAILLCILLHQEQVYQMVRQPLVVQTNL